MHSHLVQLFNDMDNKTLGKLKKKIGGRGLGAECGPYSA
jgi:hypothetical protein